MEKYTIENATENDHDDIITVWEASVRATHHFLQEEDILLYRDLLRSDYLKVVRLYCIRIGGELAAFIGLSDNAIEMLFAHPSYFSKGIGGCLAEFAIKEHGVTEVDVNEQNRNALLFYIKMGFGVLSRSERDGLGKPYPLLHMQLAIR